MKNQNIKIFEHEYEAEEWLHNEVHERIESM